MQSPEKPRGVSGQICPRRNVDCGADNGCRVCYDWVHMEGSDATTGQKVSGFDCIAHWQLKIGLQQIRVAGDGFDGVQKATESFRNEMSRQAAAPLFSPRVAAVVPIAPRDALRSIAFVDQDPEDAA